MMGVSSLREITIGVLDLDARVRQFEKGCGLAVLASGALAPVTVTRLLESQGLLRAAVMGRPDLPGSPRLRLVQVPRMPPTRAKGLHGPGPVGVGFTTRGIDGVHARLERLSVRFISPPVSLTPVAASTDLGAPPGPQRFEAFGQSSDGDFIVLIERLNAGTPYGTLTSDCSEPLHASFVVTNLEACTHFMSDVLEHQTLIAERCAGAPFDALLGLSRDVSFRFAMPHHPAFQTGRTVFIEFEPDQRPMAHVPGLGRGICRLRYDTTDIHVTLARVPGGGGSLVRGPASVDDPLLGQGLVATVRSPFGIVIELWEVR